VCRFHIATSWRRANSFDHKRRPCWSVTRLSSITFSRLASSSPDRHTLVSYWGNTLLLYSSYLPLGVPNWTVLFIMREFLIWHPVKMWFLIWHRATFSSLFDTESKICSLYDTTVYSVRLFHPKTNLNDHINPATYANSVLDLAGVRVHACACLPGPAVICKNEIRRFGSMLSANTPWSCQVLHYLFMGFSL
jgi:hypothetical protein